MSNEKKQRSIKNYLILPSYQLRLVGFICLISFVCSFLHGWLLYYLTSKKLTAAYYAGQNNIRDIWEILKPAVILSNSLNLVIICLLVFLVAVLLTHKIIGPMMKIEGKIKKLTAGRLNSNSIALRDGDEGKHLCDAVNEMQEIYKNKFEQIIKIKNSLAENDPNKKSLEEALEGIEI